MLASPRYCRLIVQCVGMLIAANNIGVQGKEETATYVQEKNKFGWIQHNKQ
jgi:hypothetical protein